MFSIDRLVQGLSSVMSKGAAFGVVPLWVCDALDEGEEYGEEEEEEGEAATDVGMDVATEEGGPVDVSDAEGSVAATWIQQSQNLSR